jgi:peptide/nickel transport system substrate-binding protein
VRFTFTAVLDPAVGSPLAGTLLVGGQPPQVTVRDPHTVTITFAAPFAPALRVLDTIPILPAHRLAAAHASGALRTAWTVTTPPGEIAGLGPFVLQEYVPGQRIVFARNPRYWKRDEAGQPLPRLDRLTLLVVPDQNAEMLRLESGEADLVSSEARPEDLAALRRAAADGRVQLAEAGVGLDPDFFWINLRPRPDAPRPAWLLSPALREAISLAVDRRAFADVVYLGAGVPIDAPITPGNRRWFDAGRPPAAFDPTRAGQLLDGLGLVDRTGDGVRDAPDGGPARLAVVTQKGNAVRERGAAFLQQSLAGVGLALDLVPFETGALVERLTAGDYDAAWFVAQFSDTDPGTHLDFWLSSGSFHVWHPEQRAAATEWEARLDALSQRFVGSADEAERQRLFRQMQQEFDAARPALYFAAPLVTIAMSPRVRGARPALLQPAVLWDAERLSVAPTP